MTEKTIYDIVHIEQKAAKEVVFMLVPSKTYGLGLFDDFFDTPFSGRRDFSNTLMKTDVQEKDGNYILDMDLPGFAKEDIKAELADGYLTIRAEKAWNRKISMPLTRMAFCGWYSRSCRPRRLRRRRNTSPLSEAVDYRK